MIQLNLNHLRRLNWVELHFFVRKSAQTNSFKFNWVESWVWPNPTQINPLTPLRFNILKQTSVGANLVRLQYLCEHFRSPSLVLFYIHERLIHNVKLHFKLGDTIYISKRLINFKAVIVCFTLAFIHFGLTFPKCKKIKFKGNHGSNSWVQEAIVHRCCVVHFSLWAYDHP